MRALVKGKRIAQEDQRDKFFRYIESDFESAYSLCYESEDRENVILHS